MEDLAVVVGARRGRCRVWAARVLTALALACGAEQEPAPVAPVPASAPPLRVAVTTPALGWLVERIGGEGVRVEGPGNEALDPAWSPSAEAVLAFSEADLVVTRGRRIETWLETASLPASRLVETTEGLELIEREGPTHSHGAEGEHSHRLSLPGTPLDPALFARQAERLEHALVAAARAAGREDLAVAFAGAAQGLATELDELAVGFRAVGARWSREEAVCSAPAGQLDYGCRALGLPPLALGEQRPATVVVLWPLGIPDPPAVAGSVVVPLDPLEVAAPGSGFDYVGRQRANLERLEIARGVDD